MKDLFRGLGSDRFSIILIVTKYRKRSYSLENLEAVTEHLKSKLTIFKEKKERYTSRVINSLISAINFVTCNDYVLHSYSRIVEFSNMKTAKTS